MAETEIEIRCPSNLRHLFMKMRMSGEQPHYTEENWIEVACNDCLREQRRIELQNEGSTNVIRVLHSYSFIGELMKTSIVRTGDNPE